MTAAELAARLPDARCTSNGWQARCPAHEDHNASLGIPRLKSEVGFLRDEKSKTERARDKAELQLAPFLAVANKFFPDIAADRRLGALQETLTDIHGSLGLIATRIDLLTDRFRSVASFTDLLRNRDAAANTNEAALFNDAYAMYQNKDLTGALVTVSEALDINPSSAIARLLQAHVYLELYSDFTPLGATYDVARARTADIWCTTELDYTEQTSWLLFLKYLDGLEQDRADEAAQAGRKYTFILEKPCRWETWAAPKGKDGKLDHNAALTGDDLRDFVNQKLFPYLHGFTQRATGPDTIEYKIGQIFGEIKNKISSGYNLREIIDHIDQLQFRSQAQKHELSALYEEKIKRMGNAGRNGGEYYTPRPLIRAMVKVVAPKIGETIYDGACGSAGFLCEAFDYLKAGGKLTTRDLETLQSRTFHGKEKKSLAYVIATMNMILHGIDAPNILHTNTLSENLADIQERDRYDIILANPPFGGKERKEVQQNFPIRTGETAFLFLQHFIKMLRAGGRAGVVIKNTFLSNTDNASVSLRRLLLESCNLHTVLDCPGGTFQGAGVKTVALFFQKGSKTRTTWYYQLDPGRNLGKTNPLNDADLVEFVKLQRKATDSPKSWTVAAKTIDPATFDLSVKNPNGGEEIVHRSPATILDEIAELDAESAEVLGNIKALL